MCYGATVELLADLGYKYEETLRVAWSDLRDLPTVKIGDPYCFYAKVYGDQYYIFFGIDEEHNTSVCDIFTKEGRS